MDAPIEESYRSNTENTLATSYDFRILGTAERFRNERAAWEECCDVEVLDKDHYVLIVHPGGARRLEA